jgi:photosystem II stability/assembly factor-like uncharacterized protein
MLFLTEGAMILSCASTLVAGINTWTTNGPPRSEFNFTFAIAIDPGDPAIFYAPPWRSSDGGRNWQLTSLSSYVDPQGNSATGVFLSAAAGPSGTVYVGTSCCYPNALSPGILLKSNDAGVNWTQASSFVGCAVERILVDPIVPSDIFLLQSCNPLEPGLPRSNRLVKSADGGHTWFPPIGQALTGLQGDPVALTLDATDRQTLYASTTAGLFKSLDGGTTWSPLFTSAYLNALVVEPSNPMVIYASGLGLGILKSTDGGRTFVAASRGLTIPLVDVLLVDHAHPSRLYAATEWQRLDPSRVFVADTNEDCWKPINNGLPPGRIDGLAIDPAGNFLLAVRVGEGVFEYDFGPDFTPNCLVGSRPQPRTIPSRH